MTEQKPKDDSNRAAFVRLTENIATESGWKSTTFERGDEIVRVAAIPDDPAFERLVWVCDSEREMIRCLVIGKMEVPKLRRPAIFELCARINQGLPFGCLEYVFDDRVLLFRDSADFGPNALELTIRSATLRVLNLGQRYAPAIASVLGGAKPEAAVMATEVQ